MSRWFQSRESSGAADSAFEILVREYHRGLLAYARSLVVDESVAEDLVQDAFIIAWQKLDQFDSNRDFSAWMRGIIRFEYLHWARKRKETPLEDEILEQLDHLHLQAESARMKGDDILFAVRHCVAELPESLRSIVESVYTRGLSCVDISRQLEASEAAIRKRLQRGRDQVEKCLSHKLTLQSLRADV